MALIKKQVVEQGDALLLSQLEGYNTLRTRLEEEIAPLQAALDSAALSLSLSNNALLEANSNQQLAQLVYDAALASYNNGAISLNQTIVDIENMTDQSGAVERIVYLAKSRNLLDETDPKQTVVLR